MKTNPDGWPVYEDTGEVIDCPFPLFVVRPNDQRISQEVVIGVHCKAEGRQPRLSTEKAIFLPADGFRYFRHPENAAAAWLELVRQEN